MRKLLMICGLLGALALWAYPQRERLSAGLKPAMRELTEAAPVQAGSPGARKCVDAAGRVLYTTDPHCPAGQREQALRGDTVNVIRLPSAAPAPAASAALPLDRVDQATRR